MKIGKSVLIGGILGIAGAGFAAGVLCSKIALHCMGDDDFFDDFDDSDGWDKDKPACGCRAGCKCSGSESEPDDGSDGQDDSPEVGPDGNPCCFSVEDIDGGPSEELYPDRAYDPEDL